MPRPITVLQVPYYAQAANLVWSGLWAGLLFVAGLLVYLQYTVEKHAGDTAYAEHLTWVSVKPCALNVQDA
jgi:hypothetical protein